MQQNIEKEALLKPAIKTEQRRSFNVWWQLLRPHTLTAAFIPVTIGTALALQYGKLNGLLFAAMFIASVLIQIATNLFNEYYDFKRGLDNENSVGIGGAIVREGVQPKTVLLLAFSALALAMILGIYICMNSSWWIALIGTICMAAGYFYTGGPIPIAYTPLGEITAGLFMGLIIILISFYIQTGMISLDAILVSIPISILVGAILLANNIRDLDGDKEHGRNTIAILLGREKAITLLATMFIISYAWIVLLVLLQIFSFWLLVVFASLPKAWSAVQGFKGKTLPIQMMPAMKATAQTNTIFGFLLTIGLLLSYWL